MWQLVKGMMLGERVFCLGGNSICGVLGQVRVSAGLVGWWCSEVSSQASHFSPPAQPSPRPSPAPGRVWQQLRGWMWQVGGVLEVAEQISSGDMPDPEAVYVCGSDR